MNNDKTTAMRPFVVKDLLGNGKSLENQIAEIGAKLKSTGASVELRNMVQQNAQMKKKL